MSAYTTNPTGLHNQQQDQLNYATTNQGVNSTKVPNQRHVDTPVGTNGITNNPVHHGVGTNSVTNHTGTAFAGTNATLGAVGQPDTQPANNLGHTDHHTKVHDLGSGNPNDRGSAGVLETDVLDKRTINQGTNGITNQGFNYGVGSNDQGSNDRYTAGSDLNGASGLHGNNKHHGAAATGATALGAHEYNKHNNHGVNNEHHRTTEPTGTSNLGAQDTKHDLTDCNHHHTGATVTSGATGAAALGAHEHNKHNNHSTTNDTQHPTSTGDGIYETNKLKHAGGGSATALEGDHGVSNSHHDHKHHNIKDDLKQGNEEPGIFDSRGVRHAGVPLHEGLAPVREYKDGEVKDTSKPSTGDKIKGNLEKIAGKIIGNEEKVVKGENLAHGHAV